MFKIYLFIVKSALKQKSANFAVKKRSFLPCVLSYKEENGNLHLRTIRNYISARRGSGYNQER